MGLKVGTLQNHREKHQMIDKPYRTKEVVEEYEVKTITVISPEGNQYILEKGSMEEFLRLRGLGTKSDAKKRGWRFQ